MLPEHEIERILKENNRLAKENQKTLKKIHRYIKWGRLMKVFWWVIILFAAFGLLWFLQPVVDNVLDTYKSFSETFNGFTGN